MTAPRKYFQNNVRCSLNLLDAMLDVGVDKIVFSSTCATYGVPEQIPIAETHPQRPINPYGESKLFVERALAWYGARDVAIYFATQERGQFGWSKPRAILTPGQAARELGRGIRKVGNPVVFSDPAGKLWLLYVTVTLGGWSGSSLNLTTSADGGLFWERSRRLTLSPFFNVSELVRNRPGARSRTGAGWCRSIMNWSASFPSCYGCAKRRWGCRHEKPDHRRPVRLSARAGTAEAQRRPGFPAGLQPTETDFVARTDDAGRSWSSA